MCTRLLTSFVLLLAACGFTLGQDDGSKPKGDPSGTWKWERTFNENQIDYTLRLKWHDDKLTGTCQAVMENGPPGLNDPVKIEDAKVEGDKLSFTVTRSFNGNEFTVEYAGKFDGDKIDGNIGLEFRDRAREFDWNAKRVVSHADVVGKWSVKFEMPNRTVESSFSLAEEGGQLKGTYHSGVFGDNPIKKIELKENRLLFVVTFENDGQEFPVSYQVEPRGGKLSGVVRSNFGGQDQEAELTGARIASAHDDDDDDQ